MAHFTLQARSWLRGLRRLKDPGPRQSAPGRTKKPFFKSTGFPEENLAPRTEHAGRIGARVPMIDADASAQAVEQAGSSEVGTVDSLSDMLAYSLSDTLSIYNSLEHISRLSVSRIRCSLPALVDTSH